MSDINPIFFMDLKGGPTLGDLADLPTVFWILLFIGIAGFVGWAIYDMNQRQQHFSDWRHCFEATYKADVDVTGLDCQAILKKGL